MIRKGLYFLGLTVLVVLVSSGFSSLVTKEEKNFHGSRNETLNYNFPTSNESKSEGGKSKISIPKVGKTFAGFKQALAFKESRGKLSLVNSFGYMGKYQFGKSTLRTVGITNYDEFLRNAQWQEKAFHALLARNKWELRKEIEKYEGKVISGITITESGILAAAHLGGAGSVKKFLRSNGRNGFKDGYGTSLRSYLKKFAGYDISHIKADKSAKARI